MVKLGEMLCTWWRLKWIVNPLWLTAGPSSQITAQETLTDSYSSQIEVQKPAALSPIDGGLNLKRESL